MLATRISELSVEEFHHDLDIKLACEASENK